jgi:hypothetical protein
VQTPKELEKRLNTMWARHRDMKDGHEKDVFFAQLLAIETSLVIGMATVTALDSLREAVEAVQGEVSTVAANTDDTDRHVRQARDVLQELRDKEGA